MTFDERERGNYWLGCDGSWGDEFTPDDEKALNKALAKRVECAFPGVVVRMSDGFVPESRNTVDDFLAHNIQTFINYVFVDVINDYLITNKVIS